MNNKIMKSGLAAMMAASLVGCSSSSGDNSNNVLTVGITAQMNGVFSPLYYESAYDAYAINLIYQSMLQYDENEELQPVLAKELPTISDDGKTVTFKLNKGVKFSDGSKLTSSDVKYTFTVLADPSYTGRFSSDVENIEGYKEYHDGDATELSGIETPDDYTVVFHMTQPRIDAVTTFGTRAICSDTQYKYKKGHISKIEKDTSNPIGSGAYKLNKYSKATGASFVRNENFKAKKGEYSIDKVIIKVCSTSTELNELQKGNLIIKKIDATSEKELSKAEFLVFNDNKIIYYGPTKENGILELKNLALGTYYIKEVKSPHGYVLDDNIYEIHLVENNKTEVVIIKNELKKGNLTIKKVDGNTKKPLYNTEFIILKDNTIIYKGITNKDGILKIDNLILGLYTIKEIKASNGYNINEEEISIIITDKENYIEITNERLINKEDYIEIPNIPNTNVNGVEILLYYEDKNKMHKRDL